MESLPAYISVTFILTTCVTVLAFCKAANYSRAFIVVMVLWLVVQGLIGMFGFYTDTAVIPPRFMLLVVPPLVVIIGLFVIRGGRQFIDNLDLKILTLLHIIRVPVEIVLHWLFIHETIPQLMTFEGRNFDILSGITAPIIFYLGFIKKLLSRRLLLAWNLVCLALLVNIVVNAILSAPFPFQKFGFDQPNIALLYFPFVWLPCCVVPLVLLSHLVAIRQLSKTEQFTLVEKG